MATPKRAALLWTIALVLVTSALLVLPAIAQSNEWDFTTWNSTGTGSPFNVSLTGHTATIDLETSPDGRRFSFFINNPSHITVTSITVRLTNPAGSIPLEQCDNCPMAAWTHRLLYGTEGGNYAPNPAHYSLDASGWTLNVTGVSLPDFNGIILDMRSYPFDVPPLPADGYVLSIIAINGENLPTPTPTPTTTPTVTATPMPWGLSIPISTGEREPGPIVGLFDAPWDVSLDDYDGIADDANILYTVFPGAGVYAIESGTVETVAALSDSECIGSLFPGYCIGPYLSGIDQRYLQGVNAYLVIVSHLGNQYTAAWETRYVLTRPNVAVGDIVAAGCLLGQTLEYFDYEGGIQVDDGHGYVVVQAESDGQVFDLTNYLIVEPAARNCAALESTCPLVADPNFGQFDPRWEQWIPGSIFPGYGVELGGRLVQQIILPPLDPYMIRLVYTPLVPDWQPFYVALGSGGDRHEIYDQGAPVGQPTTLDIEPQLYTPNDPTINLYLLVLDGPRSTRPSVRLDFICVSNEAETPATYCLFKNYEFDHPSDSWTLAGTPVASIGDGVLRMQQGSLATQDIRLGQTDWKIFVKARRFGPAVEDEYFSLQWQWDSAWESHSGAFVVDQAAFTEQSAEFTVTTLDTGEFQLSLSDSSANADVVHVDSVCLRTSNGGPPPGWGPPPAIEATCKRCVYLPTGDLGTDMAELVAWLSCALTSIYDCQFKTVLAAILLAISNILAFLAFGRAWLHLIVTGGVQWLLANAIVFAAWLNGQLVNLQISFQNTLTSTLSISLVEGGGNANLWDVLVSLFNNIGLGISSLASVFESAIGPVVALLQSIVDGLLGLGAGLLGLIASILSVGVVVITGVMTMLVGGAVDIIQALFSSFNNAAAIAVPGAPTCALAGEILYYPCLGFWVLDNTLWAGPAAYLFPFVFGIYAFKLLWWGLRRIRETAESLA